MEFLMFKAFIGWFENKKSIFIFGTFVLLVTVIMMPYVQTKLLSEVSETDIKNKLVWSVRGECYFVRPLNVSDSLLVRVTDCDKVK
jgi:hypothetical protein